MTSDLGYGRLAEALENRIRIIADRDWYARDAEDHLRALQTVSITIETLIAELPRPLPAELAHFLEKRSYEKAHLWIRDRERER